MQVIKGKKVILSFQVFEQNEKAVQYESDTIEAAEEWIAEGLPDRKTVDALETVETGCARAYYIRKLYKCLE